MPIPKYILIHSHEDGNTISWIDDLLELLNNPRDSYGVKKFLTELPEITDPNYWNEGEAILLEVKILKPKVVATAYEI